MALSAFSLNDKNNPEYEKNYLLLEKPTGEG